MVRGCCAGAEAHPASGVDLTERVDGCAEDGRASSIATLPLWFTEGFVCSCDDVENRFRCGA